MKVRWTSGAGVYNLNQPRVWRVWVSVIGNGHYTGSPWVREGMA